MTDRIGIQLSDYFTVHYHHDLTESMCSIKAYSLNLKVLFIRRDSVNRLTHDPQYAYTLKSVKTNVDSVKIISQFCAYV